MKSLDERRKEKLEAKFNYICIECKKPAKDFIQETGFVIIQHNLGVHRVENDGKAKLCNPCFVNKITELCRSSIASDGGTMSIEQI